MPSCPYSGAASALRPAQPVTRHGSGRIEADGSDFGGRRRDYRHAELRREDLAATWLEQFRRWHAEACEHPVAEPDAMVLATADARGRPSARTVLLRGVDERGFAFYTNLRSRKGREAAENPWASLVFPWYELERQVVAVGGVEPVDGARADDYFVDRPRVSQLGAHASPQSEAIADRSALEESLAQLEARYPPGSEVPRPAHWGGLRVVPETVEFWQGRPNRLHDRLRFRCDSGEVERLAP